MMKSLCDFCDEKIAVKSCSVCGSMVCTNHSLEYGCEACNSGRISFSEK